MPMNNEPECTPHHIFDSMSTEALEDILREDISQSGGDALDTDTLLYITSLLSQRSKEKSQPGKSAEEALESFKRYYLGNEIPGKTSGNRRRLTRFPGIRRAVAVAASLVVVLASLATANADEFHVWKNLYQITDGVFQFVDPVIGSTPEIPYPDISVKGMPLAQILEEFNIPEGMFPTAFPDGFVQTEEYLGDLGKSKDIAVFFSDGERNLGVSILMVHDEIIHAVEVSGEPLEIQEINDVPYFIFANNASLVIVWQYKHYQCMISGDLTMEEIHQILDSI